MYKLIFLLGCLFIPWAVSSTEKKTEQSDIIYLESGQVHQGDYFATGANVEISGRVTGDAYIAAGQVLIDGVIEGDLLLLSGSAVISGHVLGNIRTLSGQITLSGEVDGHLTAVAASLTSSSLSKIGASTFIGACTADMQGSIFSSAKLLVYNLRCSSYIEKDVSAYVGQMRLTSKADIGSLSYRSTEPALIDEKAHVRGPIDYHPSIFYHSIDHPWLSGLVIGSKFVALVMNFLFTFVFGWILLRLFPDKVERAVYALSTQTVSCLGVGLSALVLLPLISLLLLISVLGAPFAIALIALNILGFYTAKLFCVMWLSIKALQKVKIKATKPMALFLGLIAYYVITAIPYIGQASIIAAVLLGTGAILIAQKERRPLFLFFK